MMYHCCIQYRLFTHNTVEPCYNEDIGTMKMTLLYQVSPLYPGKKPRNIKRVGPAKLPCYKKVLLYPTYL